MKTILTSQQVYELISDNKYRLDEKQANLNASSYPASAAEELQIVNQTAQEYGFELADEKAIAGMLAEAYPQEAATKEYEGAVLFVTGEYGVKSAYNLTIGTSSLPVNVFVYHRQVVDAFHKELSGKLVSGKLVTLFEGLDQEYLYEVLSDTFESMLFDRLGKVAKKLPIYEVTFSDDATFIIEERGEVE